MKKCSMFVLLAFYLVSTGIAFADGNIIDRFATDAETVAQERDDVRITPYVLPGFLLGLPDTTAESLDWFPFYDITTGKWAKCGGDEVIGGGGGSGNSTIIIKEDNATIDATVTTIDFGSEFDVTEDPEDEVQITLATGLNANKTGDGSVSNEEYQRLDGLTKDILTSLNERCLESIFGTSIGDGLLLDGAVLKASTILQKYHGVDPSVDVLAALGSANDTALLTEIGAAASGANSDITSMTGLDDDGIPLAKVATAASSGANSDITSLTGLTTPLDDADINGTLTLDLLKLNVLTSAPGTPADGRIYLADNDNWDPCDIAETDNYYCIYDGSDYIAILDEDGELLISSVELPSFSHFATGDATYSDNATPHVMTLSEVKGSIITNAGASEDKVYTCPAAAFGFNFMAMVIEAYQMDIEPDGNETLWLNGTQMAGGEHIVNKGDTKGDVMSCWSVESGDGTYEIFCKSDNANWAEATP